MEASGSDGIDIVTTTDEAEGLEQPPLVVLDQVRAFLDESGLGSGDLVVRLTGDGRSNFTFLVERGDERFVLRRPPRPPYPPSAHDVVREARLQLALAPLGVRVPRVLAVCEDAAVLGVPFYVMGYVSGHVMTDTLPPGLDGSEEARRRLGLHFADVLAEIHAVGGDDPAVAGFRRSGSYVGRQLRRFGELWGINATRPLPAVDEVGRRLLEAVPEPIAETVVHGDYRLGNTILDPDDPTRIAAVVDWEMGAIGDPRADVGYVLATYNEPGGPLSPVGQFEATRTPGFPSRQELVDRYAERTGHPVDRLEWFVAFSLWKAAIFCEAIYGRYVRGELAAGDDRSATFGEAVPAMADLALETLEAG